MVFRPVHLIGSVRIAETWGKRNTLSVASRLFERFTLPIKFKISGVHTHLVLLSPGIYVIRCCPPFAGPFRVGGTYLGEYRKPPPQDADERMQWGKTTTGNGVIDRSNRRELLVCWPPLWYTPSCWEELRGSWEQHRHREGSMSRAPLHALIWSKEQRLYELYTQGQIEQRFQPAEEAAWLAWLREVSSFAVEGKGGSLNVYLEKRPRRSAYWYAYHTEES